MRWATLAVLSANLAMISLDNTILNVALPRLNLPVSKGGLGASASQLQWIMTGYIVVFAGLLLTMGSLGDRFGRYRLMVLGLVGFGSGSLLSAVANSPGTLIAGRCLMGVSAALVLPATLSILSNVFTDARERRFAVGIWSGVSAVGSISGPLAGGILLRHFWWGSLFLVNVPLVVLTLILSYFCIPESRDPQVRRLDPIGSGLSILALVALLWAIIEAPSHGWGSHAIVLALLLGMVFVAAFVAWELRVLSPMLDMRFFIDPRFSVASLAIAFTFFGMYGTSFVLTQYLQEILGLTPLGAGAMAVPQALTFFLVATQGASRAVDRLGSRIVVVTGLGSLSLSWVLLATVGKSTPLSVIVAVTCLTGAGMGLLLGPATGLIMTSVPRARAGVGSAMNDTTRQIGGALGVAVLGTILTSFARGGLGGEVVGLADPKAFLTGMHAAELVAGVVVAAALGPALRWLPAHKQELVLEEEPI